MNNHEIVGEAARFIATIRKKIAVHSEWMIERQWDAAERKVGRKRLTVLRSKIKDTFTGLKFNLLTIYVKLLSFVLPKLTRN